MKKIVTALALCVLLIGCNKRTDDYMGRQGHVNPYEGRMNAWNCKEHNKTAGAHNHWSNRNCYR